MDSNIGWELYRSFLAVMREGSLSGAARALGITQPTAGRHIAALEQALGTALFTRSQVGLRPTDIALEVKTYAEAMESTAAALERAVSGQGDGVRGAVRISASEVMGAEVLPPIVARLRAAYPELKIELVLTSRVQDLLRREADIAVRMVRPSHDQLVARRVGNIVLGLHARADYLALHGTPHSVKDLAAHALIGYDQTTAFIRQAGKALPEYTREAFSIRTDSDLAQLALIRAGAGIGICQLGLAAREPALVRVLGEQVGLPLDTWITMHEDLRTSARCRVAYDALFEGLRGYLA